MQLPGVGTRAGRAREVTKENRKTPEDDHFILDKRAVKRTKMKIKKINENFAPISVLREVLCPIFS